MYNPDYLERPYVVVLNKIDLPQVRCQLITDGSIITYLFTNASLFHLLRMVY